MTKTHTILTGLDAASGHLDRRALPARDNFLTQLAKAEFIERRNGTVHLTDKGAAELFRLEGCAPWQKPEGSGK